jgi:hypothetical protein
MTFLSHLKEWPDRERVEVVIMSAAVEVELLFGHTPGVLKALKKPFDLEEILVLAEEFAARHAPAGARPPRRPPSRQRSPPERSLRPRRPTTEAIRGASWLRDGLARCDPADRLFRECREEALSFGL